MYPLNLIILIISTVTLVVLINMVNWNLAYLKTYKAYLYFMCRKLNRTDVRRYRNNRVPIYAKLWQLNEAIRRINGKDSYVQSP